MKDKEKTKKKPIEQDSDITDYKKTEGSEREYISEMKFLADTAMDFVEFPLEKDIFQYIGEKVQEIIGNAVIYVNEFNKDKDGFIVRYLKGFGKDIKKALAIIGKDPANMIFKIIGSELSGDKAKISYEEGKTILLSGKLTRWPGGLKGDEILLEAKIICVADVVEAMSSHRPYRPALGIEKALEEISQNRGILYDPEVVDACLKLFKEKSFKFES